MEKQRYRLWYDYNQTKLNRVRSYYEQEIVDGWFPEDFNPSLSIVEIDRLYCLCLSITTSGPMIPIAAAIVVDKVVEFTNHLIANPKFFNGTGKSRSLLSGRGTIPADD